MDQNYPNRSIKIVHFCDVNNTLAVSAQLLAVSKLALAVSALLFAVSKLPLAVSALLLAVSKLALAVSKLPLAVSALLLAVSRKPITTPIKLRYRVLFYLTKSSFQPFITTHFFSFFLNKQKSICMK